MTGTTTDIVFAPLLPWPVLAGLAIGLLVLHTLTFWRRARGAWVRMVPSLALMTLLLNPQGLIEQREARSDVVVIAVDDSTSNSLGDRPARVRETLTELRAVVAADPGLEARIVSTGDGAGDQGTRLMAAIRSGLADVSPDRRAGVIALTDGRVHDADTLDAATLGAPLHVLLTGAREDRDRRLTVEAAPTYGLVGRTLEATVRLDDPGLDPGTPVPVEITRDGRPARPVTLPANRSTTVHLPVEHAGANVFGLRAAADPGELTDANNHAALSVTGVRDRLRVLLISGRPHAGERVWRDLLKADPNVDLVHFTILRSPSKDDATPLHELSLISFPIRELFEEQLENFDLVIFDRYSRRGLVPLGYLSNVARHVRRGGALLLAVGPEFADVLSLFDSPLAEVLPLGAKGAVVEAPFRPRPTVDGRRHPVTADLPGIIGASEGGAPAWGRWARLIAVQPTGGYTLLSDSAGRPVLQLSRVGDGRVGLLLSDTAWLWAKGFEGGGPLAELLRRSAHWLMKEPDLEEESLRAEARDGTLTITRRGMTPESLPDAVTVTGPRGESRAIPLTRQPDGRVIATVEAEAPGIHTITDGALTTVAIVGAATPLETARVTATDTALTPLVAASGGSVHWLGDDGLPAVRRTAAGQPVAGPGWIGLRENRAHRVTGVTRATLLPAGLAVVLVLGGLAWAWWREGR